jgi:type II secretory pathway pseudopilin PulG
VADSKHAGRSRGEGGETLVEILVGLLILGLSATALIGGFLTSITASVTHRNQANIDTILRSFADIARNSIETASSTTSGGSAQFTACTISGGGTVAPAYDVVSSLYPRSGAAGTTVAALGLGFSAVSAATFNGSSFTALGVTAPTYNGASTGATAIFKVPTLPQGTYAVDPFDGSHSAASSFTITPWAGAMSRTALNTEKVSLTGFAANSQITVTGATGSSQTPSVANGGVTSSSGTTTVTFSTSGSTGTATVTFTDASLNSTSATLDRFRGTSSQNSLDTTTLFTYLSLTTTFQYWNGSSFASTCNTSGKNQNLQQVTLDLKDSQPGNGASDIETIVLGNFVSETTPTVTVSCTSPSPCSSTEPAGTPLTFTATISPTPPGGTVAWSFASSGQSCATTTTSLPTSQCTILIALPGAIYKPTATFSGSGSYSGAAGSLPTPITISGLLPTTMTVTPSSSPVAPPANLTFNAAIAPLVAGATPTGSISWSVVINGSTATSCTTTTANVSAGTSTCAITGATSGKYTATATFAGDSNYSSSSSSASVQVLNSGTPTVTAVPSSPASGGSVTFTASVPTASGYTAPTGTITWQLTFNGSPITNPGTCVTSSNPSSATCQITGLSTGTYVATATYSGDNTFYNSGSASDSITVGAFSASVTLTCSDSKNGGTCVGFGNNDPIVYTATVTVTAGNPAPTGKIYFTGSNLPASCTAQPGTSLPATSPYKVTCSFTAGNPNGNNGATYGPVTATYSGDSNYGTGTSNTVAQIP